jgi:pyruvate dehydrogenase complex dehydrogenase (E1) component
MDMMDDHDPVETQEWVDSIKAVLHYSGPERVQHLLSQAARGGAPFFATNTPYLNTIPPQQQAKPDWDRDIEHRIRAAIRWNAVAIILRANKDSPELGGHIASFQSAGLLYDVGFNHSSGTRRRRTMVAIWCGSRGTALPASTPARSWKAASPKPSSSNSARSLPATDSLHIPIRC